MTLPWKYAPGQVRIVHDLMCTDAPSRGRSEVAEVSFAAAQSSNGSHVKGGRKLEMFSFEFHLLEEDFEITPGGLPGKLSILPKHHACASRRCTPHAAHGRMETYTIYIP